LIAAFLVLLLSGLLSPAVADDSCRSCHQVNLGGAHAEIACTACHEPGLEIPHPGPMSAGMEQRCQACHEESAGVMHGPMALRQAEKEFVARSWGQADPNFYANNCSQCHVRSCFDCHGREGHDIALPKKENCHSCHRGYYVGADYYGMAPREDALRYQRGPAYDEEHYLKMRADVHARAGMVCGDCHTMESLSRGETTGRTCLDCHEPDPQVIEHRITAHMEQLECYACHSAWAPQEYGTFFIRFTDGEVPDYFRLRRDLTAPEYIRSAYLRRQDAPPLGLNEQGRVSPIRPQFLAYFTHIAGPEGTKVVGEENRLLNAQWKAFFPHTVQRGTVMCDGCHGNAARFLLQAPEDRVYLPDKDGLSLTSFWSQQGQQVANGSFFDQKRYEQMSRRGPQYVKAYVEKWKNLAESVEILSQP